ncbi:MAG: hypothetical protein UHI54_08590 [Bifidobacterium merycicum]|nr:hypothetical protein [Bifidobacterium merycicum]MEE1295255.1 hypothetical protein [Bifidobacterium merycicum]
MLCQYFPKGTDPGIFLGDHLDAVAEEFNDRPRKTFVYRKPGETMLELINNSSRSEPGIS